MPHPCASICPLSLENVFGGLRLSGQRWLRLVTQILQQLRNSFRLRRSQCYCMQLCLCTASCNDILLARPTLSGCGGREVPRLRLMGLEFLHPI